MVRRAGPAAVSASPSLTTTEMRIVFALSLLVLQYAAGRPTATPAPPASPPAPPAARRGEGALLANGELSDLLRPLLDQLDESSHDIHKKKRILEIMPITQKGGRRTPLIILAAEVAHQKHKNKSKREGKTKKNKTNTKHNSKEHDSEELLTKYSDKHLSLEHNDSDEEEKINHRPKNKRIKVDDKSENSVESEYSKSLEYEHEEHYSDKNTGFKKLISDLLNIHLLQDKVDHQINHEEHDSGSPEKRHKLPKENHEKLSDSSDDDIVFYTDEEKSQENKVKTEKYHKNTPHNKEYNDNIENDSEKPSALVSKKVQEQSDTTTIKSDESQENKVKTEEINQNIAHNKNHDDNVENDSGEASAQVSAEVEEQSNSNSENSNEVVDESKVSKEHKKHQSKNDAEDALTLSHKDVKTHEQNIPSHETVSSEASSQELSHEIPKQVDHVQELSNEESKEHESLSLSRSHEHKGHDEIDSEVDSSSVHDHDSEDHIHPETVDVNESDQGKYVAYNPEAVNSASDSSADVSSSLDNSLPDANHELSKELNHNSPSEELSDDMTISSNTDIEIGSDVDAPSIVEPTKIIKIIDGGTLRPHPAGHYGHVIRNANKGDVKELQKIYKLSFKFNK